MVSLDIVLQYIDRLLRIVLQDAGFPGPGVTPSGFRRQNAMAGSCSFCLKLLPLEFAAFYCSIFAAADPTSVPTERPNSCMFLFISALSLRFCPMIAA
jgi:hypothetical protein